MVIAKTNEQTMARVNRLKKVIETLRNSASPMSTRQVGDAMAISETAVKSYLWTLLEAGIIQRKNVKRKLRHRIAMHSVIATQSQIDAFLAQQMANPSTGKPPRVRAPKSQAERMGQDPSRHFHLAGDDEPVKVRISRTRIPAPDPLLAAFFNMVVA